MNNKLNQLFEEIRSAERYRDGITADQAAELLGVKRSTASLYLNYMVKEGRLYKTEGYPVLFLQATDTSHPSINSFDDLMGANFSLTTQIEMCKAATDYPPDGLPILLCGESGTGKSLMASCIYAYAKENGWISKDAKYIELNCAYYANNPELLSSALFGHVKGTFTGAVDDSIGLVAEADGGYLFLDEVHRLTGENQEKLFILMDKGRYRRLGEQDNWHKANIRFIFATTEDPELVMLETFKRRIPVCLNLPDWSCRPFLEKMTFIYHFLHQEAEMIGRDLILSGSAVSRLVTSNFKGNIGSLRNEIKISCAVAHRRDLGQEPLEVHLSDMRSHVIGDEVWSGIVDTNIPQLYVKRGVDFQPSIITEFFSGDMIKKMIVRLEREGYEGICEDAEIQLRKLRIIANSCFPNYSITDSNDPHIRFFSEAVKNLMDELHETFCISLEISKDVLMLVLFDLYFGEAVSEKEMEIIKRKGEEYVPRVRSVVHLILSRLSSLQIPVSRHIYLIFYLYLIIKDVMPPVSRIPAFIISGGTGTGVSVAKTVNGIMGSYIYDGVDMPYGYNNGELDDTLGRFIKVENPKKGVLVLTDLIAPEQIYNSVEKVLRSNLLIVQSVSANIALSLGKSLIANSDMTGLLDQMKKNLSTIDMKYYEMISKENNIVISCISDVGIADRLAKIFRKHINTSLDIVTLDYGTLLHMLESDDPAVFHNTSFVLTINDLVSKQVPILPIHELVKPAGFKMIKEQLVDHIPTNIIEAIIKDVTILFTIEGISSTLSFLDPKKIINDVDHCIEAYEKYYEIGILGHVRMNLYLHIANLVERVMVYGDEDTEVKIPSTPKYEQFLEVSKQAFHDLCEKYNIEISAYELSSIYQLIESDIL